MGVNSVDTPEDPHPRGFCIDVILSELWMERFATLSFGRSCNFAAWGVLQPWCFHESSCKRMK